MISNIIKRYHALVRVSGGEGGRHFIVACNSNWPFGAALYPAFITVCVTIPNNQLQWVAARYILDDGY